MRITTRLAATILSAGLAMQFGTAAAMDDMHKDTMGKGDQAAMKKEATTGDCADHAAMGKDAMATANAGAKKDAMATAGTKHGTSDKDCMPGTMKKDAMGRDAMGHDAMGKDAMGHDAMGKDATRK